MPEGERQIVGVDAGPSEDGPFWTAFLRGLVKRGLRGVKLVISDAHEGIRKALSIVLSGASWQRCRVHFVRNLLATIPHSAREPVAAIVRTIRPGGQGEYHGAAAQGRRRPAHALRPGGLAAGGGRGGHPSASGFPSGAPSAAAQHEPAAAAQQGDQASFGRRGDLPEQDGLLRLVGAVLAEQDDEWSVAERRYFSAESMKLLTQPPVLPGHEELLAAVS